MARLRERLERRQRVFDSPEFESLAGMAALRSAVVSTFADAIKWSNSPPRNGSGEPEQGMFAWSEVRSAAESVAADRGIPMGDLDAVVLVLDVQGLWSHLAGPGCALCSAAVSASPKAAPPLLRDLFISGSN